MSRSTIPEAPHLAGLNTAQLAAATNTASRILVVAAAGSGKTKTLIARIQHMIANGTDPRSIVVITFTVAAAKVILQRLGDVQIAYAGTLHGFCLRILQQHGNLIGLPPKLTILDEAEAEDLLVDAIAKMSYKGTRKSVDDQVALGLAHMRSGDTMRWDDVTRVAYEYFYGMTTSGCLTFDMILTLGLELIQKMSRPKIGDYQNLLQYQHLMVDEAQDSSETDWQIYQALPVKTRFIIGDPRQRIYSFRGACNRFEHMTNAESDTWLQLMLFQNYRSGAEIVIAANHIMREFPPMQNATGALSEVMVEGYDTAAEEMAATSSAIKSMITAGVDANEIAVLTRTNAIAADFRKALTAHGIPVRQRKQQDNPRDWSTARAFIALLTNPENDRLAYKFAELKLGSDRANVMRQKAVDDFTTINDAWLHIGRVPLNQVTSSMVAAGIERESVGRVRAMIEMLPPDATLLELQAAIAEMEAEAAEETDGVTVCTAHASKGREWQAVFVVAAEEGIWPSKREIDDDHGSEVRRLFYVAVTRAKEFLSVSYAGRRERQWKGVQEMTPSRFISEMK